MITLKSWLLSSLGGLGLLMAVGSGQPSYGADSATSDVLVTDLQSGTAPVDPNPQPETISVATDPADPDLLQSEPDPQSEPSLADRHRTDLDLSPAMALTEARSTDADLPTAAVPVGGFWLNPALINGERIAEVRVYLENPPEDAEANQRLEQQILTAFTVQVGDSANPLFLEAGLQRVQQLSEVEAAQYGLYEVQIPGEVVVVLSVRLVPGVAELPPPSRSGILVTGDWREFPNLYTSDRATAVAVLRGGLSNFTSFNTWFGQGELLTQGNPLAPNPAGPGTYSWFDGYLELGLAGITQVSTWPLYVYGGASSLVSTTVQPDLFESDSRIFLAIEDLYGGVIYGYRTEAERLGVNLSVGRQDYRISNGLLFANGAGNGGDRAAVLSNPRTAFENTVIGRFRWNDLRLEGFYLDPNELSLIDSQTKFVGVNLDYDPNSALQLGLSYIHVPNSNFSYFTLSDTFSRQGLNVVYPRLRLTNPLGINGLWLQAEYVHQWNSNFAMAAHGAWGQLGYTFRDVPWTPTLSYRYAYFSGDDPNTTAFERFDPLLSGGNPDTWIQGTNLVKIYQNSNLITHQLLLRTRPFERFDLTLQYIHLSAANLNNLGGTQALSFLQSSYIGQEITLTARYNLSRNFLLYGSGSIAFPGSAVQQALSTQPGPWYFLQLSFLMNF
ncbi:MAG: alginate export family protein [Leptolyngbyaceae cyanobacterium SM2_5_2]|nr:alginate export family protein [Leptolyngbyaceae cyanobacterium SM2_5_2]